jgi:hypothetical protein
MGIHFYHPEFLIALLFAGFILAIHLLRKTKTVAVRFSTLRFFTADSVRKSKSRKLRKLLLLITRLLLAIMIIVMFARPYIQSNALSNLQNPNASIFIWIDHSLSMDYIEKSVSSGQRAMALVDSLVAMAPPTAKVFIYENDQNNFIEYSSGDRQFRTMHGDLQLEKVFGALKSHYRYKSYPVFIVMSDFQETTSNQLDSLLKKERLATDVIYVSLTPEKPWNYAIQSVNGAGGGDAIEVVAGAYGRELTNGQLRVSMGNLGTAPVQLSIPENGMRTVSVPFSLQENKTGKVVLDEKDPLAFDNVAFIGIGSRTGSDILVLGNSDENFVIAAALKALGERSGCRVIQKNFLDLTSDDINTASVILINHPSIPCPLLENLLSNRNGDSHTFLYCLSEDSLDLVSDFALLKKRFPTIERFKHSSAQQPVFPVLPDNKSGLWHGFPENRWQQLSIHSYAQVLPGIPLCQLSDGGVLLSTIVDPLKSKWVISAIPLGINNVCTIWESGVYVPFLDRIVKFLDVGSASSVRVIAGYPLKNPLYSRTDRGYIYDPEGKPLQVADRPEIVLPNPGVYKVAISGAPTSYITVQSDSLESKMNFRAPNTKRTLYNNAVLCTENNFCSLAAHQRSGIASWLPWLLIGLLMVLEIVLWENVQKEMD